MLRDYLEPFCRLTRREEDDGLGGTRTVWKRGQRFQGGITHVYGREVHSGGVDAVLLQPVLVYDGKVPLRLHDRVLRLSDGAVYRVADSVMRGPKRLPYSQVRVKQVSDE